MCVTNPRFNMVGHGMDAASVQEKLKKQLPSDEALLNPKKCPFCGNSHLDKGGFLANLFLEIFCPKCGARYPKKEGEWERNCPTCGLHIPDGYSVHPEAVCNPNENFCFRYEPLQEDISKK
ncbi:MAG: NADH pyrophosphatase zinc ribbon domain-containing protein [Candidatus Nanoarchaeia archaeon]|nr:NADH pyrophosphatase zinc ribbon domain-containing protein [Candidatus Nanoarchaeia archaeon]